MHCETLLKEVLLLIQRHYFSVTRTFFRICCSLAANSRDKCAKHIVCFAKWALRTCFPRREKIVEVSLACSACVVVFTIIQESIKASLWILLYTWLLLVVWSEWLFPCYANGGYNHCIFVVTCQWSLFHLSFLQDTIIWVICRTCLCFTRLFTFCFLFWLLFDPQLLLLLQQLGCRE